MTLDEARDEVIKTIRKHGLDLADIKPRQIDEAAQALLDERNHGRLYVRVKWGPLLFAKSIYTHFCKALAWIINLAMLR